VRLIQPLLAVPTPLRWLAVVAWAGLIFMASNQPGLAVSDDPAVDRPLRQVAHMAVYAVLTLLLAWAMSGSRPTSARTALAAGVLALLYGVTDEWHQTMVPTRHGRPEDLIWDGLGIAIAMGTIVLINATVRDRDPGGPPRTP
jgi:VanZ family protein